MKLDILKKVFYELSLSLEEDENGNLFGYSVWSNTRNLALTFDFDNNSEDDIKIIVSIINGTYTSTSRDNNGGWVRDGENFSYNGQYKFCVRGWGSLTGRYKLSVERAIEVQEFFAEKIIKKLNNEK